ncbi:hypothetical protein ACFL7D_02045 [candidate division KSB1 bacterium]
MDKIREKILNCNKCKEFGLNYNTAKEQNFDNAYNKYKPDLIKLLWIIESPPYVKPGKTPRYFYRPGLIEYRDILIKQIMGVLKISISGTKVESLKKFQELGHFLIDAAKCPVNGPNKEFKPQILNNCIDILQMEIEQLDPENIIIIKKGIFNHIYSNVKCSGLEDRVLNKVPLPFPVGWDREKFPNVVSPYIENI